MGARPGQGPVHGQLPPTAGLTGPAPHPDERRAVASVRVRASVLDLGSNSFHVLVAVLDRLRTYEMTISDWGLREGLLLDAHGVVHPPHAAALRRGEVERVRTSFVPDDHHPPHVATLAGALFDATEDPHGLGHMEGDHIGDRPVPRLGGRRPRYTRRVGAEDVGARVSIRSLVDDPERGPLPSDTVGRLLAIDDEVVLIVDREGQLTVLAADRVLASRVIPAHPRLPPEPAVPTREQPLRRHAARVLLVRGDPDDETGRPAPAVLLVGHRPSAEVRVWTAPGGGLLPSESSDHAARRELREELGLELDPGPWVGTRTAIFPYRGIWLEQHERWAWTPLAGTYDPADAPLDDVGTDLARWFTLAELDAAHEHIAPATLGAHVERFWRHGPPSQPVDLDRPPPGPAER